MQVDEGSLPMSVCMNDVVVEITKRGMCGGGFVRFGREEQLIHTYEHRSGMDVAAGN